MIKEEIKNHKIASKKLDLIKDRAFKFVFKNLGKITERDVNDFINSEFKKEGLVSNAKIQIVAVGSNTGDFHHFSSNSKIKRNQLIMIDIWARLKGVRCPFADITWMGYTGSSVPLEIKEVFDKVINARNLALTYIISELKKKKFPRASMVDKVVRDYFGSLEKHFHHRTGHSLGFVHCHGKKFRFSKTTRKRIIPNVLFTIEPGLYFKGKFGVRSEIDCYISSDYRLVVTSGVQGEMVLG
jgi:Xaa-Pro aminopeptidase